MLGLRESYKELMPVAEGPLVSIVTPSFNQGTFIGQTIASVLGQDYPRIEYLVVDGGSTDGTLEVLRRFGDRLGWVSEPDRGQSDAINKGWRKTRGEVIAWLNADDLYRPGAVRKVVEFFRAHPDIDLVYGDCEFINEQGGVVGRHNTRPANGADLLRSPISIIAQPATFLRRRVLQTVGHLDETLHYMMDFEYWVRVAARHSIVYLPECLAAFRIHRGSKSVSQAARLEEERLHIYERLYNTADLPDHLRCVEREAMRNAYTRVANNHFLAGNMKVARHYALAAWRSLPWKLHRTQLKVLVLGLVWPRGPQLAGRLKKPRIGPPSVPSSSWRS